MNNKKELLESINYLQAITFDFSLTKEFEMVKDKHQRDVFAITNMAIELREILHKKEIDVESVHNAFDLMMTIYNEIYDKKGNVRKSITCKTKVAKKLARDNRIKNYKTIK